jgi:(p)ppGpp synthase/HD superfamily hydrolase
MNMVQQALQIAVEAHAGQVDKAGQPYAFHPIRMALRLRSDDERVVALLHDVVEDCPGWTFERLAALGFSPHIIEALRSVTKDAGADLSDESSYMAFIRRAGANPIGRAVKRADLEDNMDLSRIAAPTARDHARIEKYRRAVAVLDEA